MQNLKNKITYIFILGIILIPSFVKADWILGSQLVPCNPTIGEDGTMTKCGFGDLVQLANNLIDFIIYISVSVSAIMFAYAGFLYITSSTSGNIEKAHSIFKSVGIGLIFILGAWLIVKAVLVGLGANQSLLNF
ncbi:MAG: hypothetical protein KAS02_02225 [Candidatus Pacebacteria bacterium]|nr:hypothetical protein [Candidatus Paceibacterota bacterium]